MRIILTGSPTNALRVTAAMLPADKNLAAMYARFVDFSGLDLSGFNLRDADLIDCKAVGVNLTGADVDNLYCLRTPFTGAVLPSDISYCTNGLVEEAMRQRLALVVRRRRPIVERIIQRVESENGSYVDSLYEASQTLDLSIVEGVMAALFQPWPTLARALARGARDVRNGHQAWVRPENTVTRPDGTVLTVIAPVTPSFPDDRTEAAALLEVTISSFLSPEATRPGEGQPVRVQVFRLTPFLWFRWENQSGIREPGRRDWWRGGLWRGQLRFSDNADDDVVVA